ncbi:MAG TPA: hypothetical protein VJP02_05495 [Candidatus Sulfotelmatobacter sp.]|nr:hypothetical protein [Candidatus Sulfotelmatobacter sp.]
MDHARENYTVYPGIGDAGLCPFKFNTTAAAKRNRWIGWGTFSDNPHVRLILVLPIPIRGPGSDRLRSLKLSGQL